MTPAAYLFPDLFMVQREADCLCSYTLISSDNSVMFCVTNLEVPGGDAYPNKCLKCTKVPKMPKIMASLRSVFFISRWYWPYGRPEIRTLK